MGCQVENVVQMGWFCQIKYTFFFFFNIEFIFPSLLKLPILDGIKLQYGLKFSLLPPPPLSQILEFGNT